MDETNPEEAAWILRRSAVLDACRDESLSRSQLADAAELSRTTAYRATRDLESEGLLERTAKGYRTTPHGAALSAAAGQFLSAIETIGRLEALLELVDHPELTAHAHLLADAEITVADAANPYRVVDRVLERLAETTTSRGIIVNVTSVEALDRAAPDIGEMDAIERIFTESALSAHLTIGEEAFADVAQSEVFSYLVADDETVPFSFALDDEDVTLVGHDPATGLPTIHAESNHPAARAWLEDVYERVRAEATELSPP